MYETQERTQLKMGTFVKIQLQAPRWYDFDNAFNKAFSAIDRIEKIASMYDEDSELNRINRTAHKRPVALSDDLFLLVKTSMELSRNSDGAFDITVAPLVRLWKPFIKGKALMPTAKEIKKTLEAVGYKKITLDEKRKTIFFTRRGMAIDLSAIAKGYAVDNAVAELKKAGCRSAIVRAGGDLYCLGKKNFYQPWHIGIRDPKNENNILGILYLSDKAVATSGGYEQFRYKEGKTFTHLIDPSTGYPKDKAYFSITVTAPNCMLADGIATAVSVGGDDLKNRLKDAYPDVDIEK
jgi:thiamine biosynthesis lipoprotein